MKTIKLNEQAVRELFTTPGKDQGDLLVDLYRMAFGADWDRIVKLDGWPTCNKSTWKSICQLFMDFDKKHTNALPGGLWMNTGFSSHEAEDLKDWQVRLCPFSVAEVADAA